MLDISESSLRSFTLRNFIEDRPRRTGPSTPSDCEALRFATSLRNAAGVRHAHMRRAHCEALRFATSLRKPGRGRSGEMDEDCEALRFATSLRTRAWEAFGRGCVLRSFTLRNFIEERNFRPCATWQSILRSFTLRNFIEERWLAIPPSRRLPNCEALRFATSLRTGAVKCL